MGTLFVIFLFPETKGIPIEEVPNIFRNHWFWRRYAGDPGEAVRLQKQMPETELAMNGSRVSDRSEQPPTGRKKDKDGMKQSLVSMWEPKSDDLAAHTTSGRFLNGTEPSSSLPEFLADGNRH